MDWRLMISEVNLLKSQITYKQAQKGYLDKRLNGGGA